MHSESILSKFKKGTTSYGIAHIQKYDFFFKARKMFLTKWVGRVDYDEVVLN